jgi:hypothetical protein
VPTQPPVTEPLTVHITNIPKNIQNNTTVPVGVTTSQPGVAVHLSVTYYSDGMPVSTTEPQETDDHDNATISWKVQVPPPGTTTLAQVTAIAQDQQGRQVTSSPVMVLVNSQQGQ